MTPKKIAESEQIKICQKCGKGSFYHVANSEQFGWKNVASVNTPYQAALQNVIQHIVTKSN